MISLPLKFDEVESVEEFVNMVKRLDYDVDVKIGRCVFDAKSLMSVLIAGFFCSQPIPESHFRMFRR